MKGGENTGWNEVSINSASQPGLDTWDNVNKGLILPHPPTLEIHKGNALIVVHWSKNLKSLNGKMSDTCPMKYSWGDTTPINS